SDSLTSYVPDAATRLQALRPNYLHRAVAIDGSLREGFAYGPAIAGNPFGNPAAGEHRSSTGVRLDTGTCAAFRVDMCAPAPGFTVPVSRSHSARQQDATPAYCVSDGAQGKNRGNPLFMGLVFHDDDGTPATLDAEDMAYV